MQGVGASCDGLTVSVVYLPPACTSPTLLLYDTRGLLLPSPDSPFASHVLNTSSSLVTGVHWNPTIAATFCVTFADGALAMYTLGVASGNVGGANCDTLPPATGVVAISWSPKGKQMVAVKKDGSLTQVFGHSFKNAILTMCLVYSQYKPDLKEAKSWPGPGKAGLLPVSIFWLSTYEFLVGYRFES